MWAFFADQFGISHSLLVDASHFLNVRLNIDHILKHIPEFLNVAILLRSAKIRTAPNLLLGSNFDVFKVFICRRCDALFLYSEDMCNNMYI